MKSLNKTSSLLVVALAVLLVVSGAYAFFYVVMKNKTSSTNELSARITQNSEKNIHYVTLTSALKNERENIEKLSSYFIKESEIVAFTKKIEALGVQSNTVLTIGSLEPVMREGKISVLNFNLRAVGKFEDIMRLIALLENFPAKLQWNMVRIEREDAPVVDSLEKKNAVVSLPDWRLDISLTALNFIKE